MSSFSRRDVLRTLSALPVLAIAAACTSESDVGGAGAPSTTAGEPDTGSATTGNETDNDTDGAESEIDTIAWAAGTTALITVPFPDDELLETGGICDLGDTAETALGPCWFADDTGPDISEGLTGLPMQLSLRLVDGDCAPRPGQVVEVWHTDRLGRYSGDTSGSADSSEFDGERCTLGDDEARASSWYRGQLTTNDSGRVDFLTHFPGWYSGRTIHVHVAVGDGAGNRRFISQFAFTDAFAEEICTGHELYAERGAQDTPATEDGLFRSDDVEPYLFDTRRNSDGTLLAFRTIRLA